MDAHRRMGSGYVAPLERHRIRTASINALMSRLPRSVGDSAGRALFASCCVEAGWESNVDATDAYIRAASVWAVGCRVAISVGISAL